MTGKNPENTDRSEEEVPSSRPVTSPLKSLGVSILVIIILLAIVFVIAFVFMPPDDGNDSNSVTEVSEITGLTSPVLAQESDTEDPDTNFNSSLLAIEKDSAPDDTQNSERDERIEELEINHQNNSESIEKMTAQLSSLQDQFWEINRSRHEQSIEIQNMSKQIAEWEAAQKKRDEDMKKKVFRAKKIRKTYKRKRKPVVPTFTLESIDLWGDNYTIIVRYKNKRHELRQGQSINQWRVERVDLKNSQVTFHHPTGGNKTLSIRL